MMPSTATSKAKIAAMLLGVLLGLAILFVDTPVFHPVPDRDSGGFMYIGQQMLRGEALYSRLYDDKPPLIFAVNMLGLAASGGSPWGVWALEVLFLSTAVISAVELLSSVWGLWPMMLAVLAFLGSLLSFLLGGNFTEEYALPFQLLILLLILPNEDHKLLPGRAFLAGAAWGVVFYFKQSIFGIGLAAGAYLLARAVIQRRRSRFGEVLWYAAGFVGVNAAVVLYFSLAGTLYDFWDATFLSNFAYIGPANVTISRTTAIINVLTRMIKSEPFLIAALAAWLVLVQLVGIWVFSSLSKRIRWPQALFPTRRFWMLIFKSALLIAFGLASREVLGAYFPHLRWIRWGSILIGFEAAVVGLLQITPVIGEKLRTWAAAAPARSSALVGMAALSFPLDILSISLSGKSFTHYYLIAFPSATVLLAATSAVLFKGLKSMHAGKVQPVFAVAWILLFTVYPLSKVNRPYQVVHQPQRETVLAYIQANTKPGDEVLVWGGEPVINFLSGREMPLRFVFMSQPFLAGYATERFAGEILTELKAHPPAIIIDSRNCAIPFLDYMTFACIPVTGYWTPVYDYIRQSYRLTTHLGSANWGIYTYTQ